MKKNAAFLMFAATLAKLFGFIRDITLSYYYGASYVTDAYIVSLAIPNTILALLSVGINTSYIPIYSEIEKKSGLHRGNTFTNHILNSILILCTLIIAVVFLFTKPIVLVFASGFEEKAINIVILFTRINIVRIYFFAVSHLLQAYLQLKNSYIIPSLLGLPMNIMVILSILISSKTNLSVLAVGSVVASLLDTVLLLLLAYRKAYRYKPELDIKDQDLKKMSALVLPAIAGSSANQLNHIADKAVASRISEGAITALSYAHQLESFVSATVSQSISTVIYPKMAKKTACNDMDGLKEILSSALILLSLLIIPGSVGAMVFSKPVVTLLFNRGAFDSQAVMMTSNALFFYSLGMIWFGFRKILTRAFYSLQDTKTPLKNSFLAVAVNICLNIILSRFLGIGGLALATSITGFLSMCLLIWSLYKKIGYLNLKSLFLSFVKILFASLFMGYAAYLIYQLLLSLFNKNLSLIVSMGFGAVVYTVVILFMKIDVVDATAHKLIKKLKRLP